MGTSPVKLDFSTAIPIADTEQGNPAAQALQRSLYYGAQQNPDEHARLLSLQQQTGIAPEVAKLNQAEIQQSVDRSRIDPYQMAVSHPRTAAWASNPDNAAVAGVDEIQRMARIEQHAATMSAWTPTLWQRVKETAADATKTLTGSTPADLKRNLFEFPLTRAGIDVVGGSAGLAGDVGSFFGVHGAGSDNRNLLQRVEAGLSPEANLPEGNVFAKDNGVDWLAKNVAPMLPLMLTGAGEAELGARLGLSRGALRVLGGLTAGGLFTAQAGGQTYTRLVNSGMSPYDARIAANRVAAISALPNALFGFTEMIPGLRVNPLLASTVLGGVQGAAGQMGQNVAVTGKPWYAGMAGSTLQGAAMQAGMHIGMGFFESLDGAIEEAQTSKLRERAPEVFTEALKQQFSGQESLRIPAERFNEYFQSKGIDPAEAAKGLGSTNYAEASLSGGDVEVRQESFLSQLDKEHQDALREDVVNPAIGMSRREMQAAGEELSAWANGDAVTRLAEEMQQADAETQATPEWQAVFNDLKQRYVDAGEKEDAAEGYATLNANAIANFARRAGMKPDELLALHNPEIVAAETREGFTYNQSPVPDDSVEGLTGNDATLHTPSSRIPAAYRLVEADSLIASHNPRTFERNVKYPDGVQERAYDRSKEAQARVIQQAQSYEPAYTVNSNPDAVNGPPVITPDGIVLGGNSRTMATQRLYEDDGSVYRDYLRKNAEAFGFTPEQVDAMKKPVLVRQIAAPEGTEALRRLGSELNKSMTGALGVAERAVSAGKNIAPETLRWVADTLNADDSTLRELMGRHGQEVVRRMVQDRVITERERPQFVDAATGGLSEEGKTFVERALLGSVIDDPRLMDAAPKSILQKLERSLGSITSFASREDEWNILPAIRTAVGELGSIQREGSTVELRIGQFSLFGGDRNPLVDALVRKLDGKPTAVKAAFDDFARDADENLPGQARMFGGGEAFDAFNHAFGSKLTAKEFHDGLDEVKANAPAGSRTAQTADTAGDQSLPERAGGEPAPGGESGAGSLPERAEAAPATGADGPVEPPRGWGTGADGPVEPPRGWGTSEVAGTRVEKRGWFRVLPDGRFEIGKTKLGDLSTFIHEPAHGYLELFRELTQRESASQPLKDDFRKLTEWLGTTPEEAWKNGLTREQHEQWARANEQYVREGKAPTSGLRRAFHNFSVWLSSIYRRASALGVELSSDIRGVMDRLYAGEDAVERANAATGPQTFTSPEEAGWTEEQYRNYAEAKGVALDKAREKVRAEMNAAADRERTQAWREERTNVRDAVTQQVDAQREYTAIRSLRRGALEDGTRLTLNRGELVKQFGEERVAALQQQHRGLYRLEGGTDPETAAEILGFQSADEMMRTLTEAPRRSKAIEAGVREAMTARHGDIRYDGSLDDKARLAVENDDRAKGLHQELTALRRRVKQLEKRAADTKAAMRAITVAPIEAYQKAAHAMIEVKAPADIQPHRYLDASRKYSREAFDALRKGSVERAADAKHKELLNHFLYREAMAASDYLEKFEKYVKQSVQSKGIQQRMALAGSDFRDQYNWLLARHALAPVPAEGKPRPLSEWADERARLNEQPALAPSVLDENRYRNYRNVPLSEIRDLHDALVNIRALAKQQFELFVQGKKQEFAQARQSMVEAARTNLRVKPEHIFSSNESRAEKAAGLVARCDAMFIRMERVVEWLDGGKTGPWHDHMWNLAADSQGDEYALQQEVTSKLHAAVEAMPKEWRDGLTTKKVAIEGISEPFTRKELLSMALNMGNDGNLDRLRKTFIYYDWDPAGVENVKRALSRDDWQFVQHVWDMLVPLGERMRDFEKRLTGLPPKMVEVTPLRLRLGDGTDMDLRGGYYPIDYDPRFAPKGFQEEAGKKAQNVIEAGLVRATTSRGYTKERSGFGGPLLFDFERTLSDHTAQVIKDLTHRELVLHLNRMLTDPEITKALRETLGPAYEKQFMPWLRAIVNDRNGSNGQGLSDFSAMMGKLRGNLTTATLGFKVTTSLLQVTHAPRMLLYTKPGTWAQAMVDFMAHPQEMTREIKELSPNEMRFRGDSLDRDIRTQLSELTEPSPMRRMLAQAANVTLKYIDHMLSFPLWLSVYRDALKEHVDLPEADARYQATQKADSAVRLGLGSQAPKDIPAIMRNNDATKLLTMFYGFHNGIYNQVRDVGHQFRYDRNVGKLTYGLTLSVLVPAVLSQLVMGKGPEDGENAGVWAAKRALLFGMDTVPVLRDLASGLDRDGSVRFSPLEDVMEKVGKAILNVGSGRENKDWTGIELNALESAMDVAGVPGTTQAMKVARYVHRAQQGRVENPNAWDAIVGGSKH